MLKEMYYENKFLEVVDVFEANCSAKEFSEIDHFYYMNSLYKLTRYVDCLKCYKKFVRKFKDSTLLNDKMGWAIYQLYFKNIDNAPIDIDDLTQKADYAIRKSSETVYSPRRKLVESILYILFKKSNFSDEVAKKAKYFLELVDYNSLSKNEIAYLDKKDGQMKTKASDFEDWHSKMSKVLLSLGETKKCIEVCDNGLALIHKFHNNNDAWFKYRKAQCLYSLGDFDKTISLVKEIMAQGLTHWVFLMLLFQSEACKGNHQNALGYATRCSMFDKKHEVRIKFYEEFAAFLDEHGYKEEAMLHRRFIILIRQEEGWKIKSIQENWEFDNSIGLMNRSEVQKRLKEFWNNNKNSGRVAYKGKIQKILPQGNSGFIFCDDGTSYYFNTKDMIVKNSEIMVGQEVEFFVEDKFDKRKNQISKAAVDIDIL